MNARAGVGVAAIGAVTAIGLVAVAAVPAGAAATAGADGRAGSPAPVLVRQPSLTLEAANRIAAATIADCRRRGASIAVAVVDRGGQLLALQRDPLAGMHAADTASRKAWTAVSFRGTTSALVRATGPDTPNHGIRQLPGVAIVGGGVPVEAAGSLVGGVGVSGAPTGELDEQCAVVGVDAVRDDLELGG